MSDDRRVLGNCKSCHTQAVATVPEDEPIEEGDDLCPSCGEDAFHYIPIARLQWIPLGLHAKETL
jgi:hypothetical protein